MDHVLILQRLVELNARCPIPEPFSQEGGAESGVLAKQCRAAPWGLRGVFQKHRGEKNRTKHEIEGYTH